MNSLYIGCSVLSLYVLVYTFAMFEAIRFSFPIWAKILFLPMGAFPLPLPLLEEELPDGHITPVINRQRVINLNIL